jgi:hypothetical protein
MGHYPFTLFNAITAFVLALTVMLMWRRVRGAPAANWPLVCYAVMVAYTICFSGGLNPYWVAAGVACGLAIRLGFHPSRLRWAEAIPLGYVAWRCLALLLMW